MATGNMSITTLDEFIPEVWSKKVLLALYDNTVFRGLVNTQYGEDLLDGGDKVHAPATSAVTIGTKVVNTAMVKTNYTESVRDITVDQFKYFCFLIEDSAKKQAGDYAAAYVQGGSEALANDLDTYVAALAVDAEITQNVGTMGSAAWGDITDAMIRAGVRILDVANAPESGRKLIVSPYQWEVLTGIDRFSLVNQSGNDATLRNSEVGRLYGVDIYKSNNLSTVASVASVASPATPHVHDYVANVMFHTDAFGLAVQTDVEMEKSREHEHKGDMYSGTLTYGADILRPTFAVQLRTGD